MAYDTAANILNDAAVSLALIATPITDPYGSTDVNIVQLCQALNDLGQDLLRDYQWSQLRVRYSFPTVNATPSYALPTDFDRYLDQTGWDQTNQLPLAGPANAPEWELLKAQAVASTVNAVFSIFDDLLYLHPTPASVRTIAYAYQSSYWVKETGQSARNTERADAATDILYFDRRLLVTGLRLAYLEEKGFDTTAALGAYEAALSRAQGKDGAAPVLSLNGPTLGVSRMLDGRNIPDTGYGG